MFAFIGILMTLCLLASGVYKIVKRYGRHIISGIKHFSDELFEINEKYGFNQINERYIIFIEMDTRLFITVLILLVLSTLSASTIVMLYRRRTVLKTSHLITELLEINEKYVFNQINERYTFKKDISTKPKFDRFQVSEFLDEIILTDPSFKRVINSIMDNRIMYERYQNEINQLKSEITDEEAKTLRISYSTYTKIEQRMFQERQLQPILDSEILCDVRYTSPKGYNQYFKSDEYTINQVLNRINILARIIDFRSAEEERRKQERAKMSDKIRYTILKRDGFRCKICGRTADDGVRLHVDHIIPISKGGKTEINNLQTLCESCNLGKSDTI